MIERIFATISKDNKMLNLISMGRPWNGLILGIYALLGYTIAGGEGLVTQLGLFITFFLQYFGGAIINDIYDLKTDTTNMPYRPLTKKIFSISQAKYLAAIAYGISFLIATQISLIVLGLTIVFFIFSILYSMKPIRLVGRGFLGNISLAIVTIAIPLTTGILTGDTYKTDILSIAATITTLTIFFAFFSIIKDFKDIEGDLKTNKKTFATKHGLEKAKKIFIFGTISSYLTFLFFGIKIFKANITIFAISSSLFLIGLILIQKGISKVNSAKEFENLFSMGRVLLLGYSISLFFSI